MTTPHDAEEAMRPYLGRIYDAKLAFGSMPVLPSPAIAYGNALSDALDKALELLGVQR